MNVSEEEVEQRLRALFTDERLDLPPPADATRTIVAGARRVRRRRRALAATSGVAAAAVAVTGGLVLVKVRTQDDAAALSTGPGLSLVSPAPTSSAAPPLKPSPKRVTTGPLLDSDGIGPLRLRMTESDVTAQGVTLTDAPKKSAGCTYYVAQGGGLPATANVAFSATKGLALVSPTAAVHTQEGIGSGSTKDDVFAVYAGAALEPGGIVAPARGAAEYHFTLNGAGSVAATSLSSVDTDCA